MSRRDHPWDFANIHEREVEQRARDFTDSFSSSDFALVDCIYPWRKLSIEEQDWWEDKAPRFYLQCCSSDAVHLFIEGNYRFVRKSFPLWVLSYKASLVVENKITEEYIRDIVSVEPEVEPLEPLLCVAAQKFVKTEQRSRDCIRAGIISHQIASKNRRTLKRSSSFSIVSKVEEDTFSSSLTLSP